MTNKSTPILMTNKSTLIQAARKRVSTDVTAAPVLKGLMKGMKEEGFNPSVSEQTDGSTLIHVKTLGPGNLRAVMSVVTTVRRYYDSSLKNASMQVDGSGISIHIPVAAAPSETIVKWVSLCKKVKAIKAPPSLSGFEPLHRKAGKYFEQLSILEIGKDDAALAKALRGLDAILDDISKLPPQAITQARVTKDLMKTIREADIYTEADDMEINTIDVMDPLDWLMLASLVNVSLKRTENFRSHLDTGSRDELPDSLYTLLGHDED